MKTAANKTGSASMESFSARVFVFHVLTGREYGF
jgi:hypothetical protein